MNTFRIILGMIILIIAGIASLIVCYKMTNSISTTVIYGIYIIIILILSLFALIGLEQYWITH